MTDSEALITRETGANIGHETLHRIGGMDRTNRWMFEVLRPHIGQRVIEAGAGSGNLTRHLLDRERIACLDLDPAHVRALEERYGDREGLSVHRCDISDSSLLQLAPEGWDTVVCVNVLEHIQDDRKTLRNFHAVLRPGGRAVVLVPALPFLFSTLDEALEHYRRYSRRQLAARVSEAGFRIVETRYLNLFGIPGWFLSGKILRRRILPARLLGLFNMLVPAFRLFERLTGPPLGLSVIAIGEKM